MKTRHLYLSGLTCIAMSLASVWLYAAPLGTAFTYQGRLNDGGNPATGIFDVRFALFDAPSGGALQGDLLTNAATVVSNGLFTVPLDFGAGVFGGNARWLEIAVRTNGGGGFVPLVPRQALTPTPYALYAPSAGTASAAATSVTAASVPAAGIAGTLPDARLSPNVALLNQDSAFSGDISAARFYGDAVGLTNLNSSRLTGALTVAGGFMEEKGWWGNGYQAMDAVQIGDLMYVANGYEGLRILDVSSFAAPVALGRGATPGSDLAVSVAVSGSHAYLACQTMGLYIFDVSNPTNVVLAGHVDDGGEARGVAVIGTKAYLANGSDGLRIYDVSAPAAPVLLSHVNDGGTAIEVAIFPPYPSTYSMKAYLANGADGLRIYDVTTPNSPTNIGHVVMPAWSTGAKSVCVENMWGGQMTAFVGTDWELEVMYVQYPASASIIRAIPTSGTGPRSVSDVRLRGDRLYLAVDHNGASGHLEIIDVPNSQYSARVCEYPTYRPARAVVVDPNGQFIWGAQDNQGILTYQTVFAGTATAQYYQGSGRLLSEVNADKLDGQHGAYYQNADNLTSGTVAEARLSSSVPLLHAHQAFGGSNTFNGVLRATNPNNLLSGTLTGNAATAGSFTGSLAGDVTGTQGGTVVGTVGGRTAAYVASGADAANGATDANTTNAIVRRDAAGNFSAGTITAAGFSGDASGLTIGGRTLASTKPTYRWAVWSTYDQGAGWFFNNASNLTAGVPPQKWSDDSATADQISSNKTSQAALFNKTALISPNSTVWAETRLQYSSTDGRMAGALFRVRNNTATNINWSLTFFATAYPGWGEKASVALNGANVWSSSTDWYATTSETTVLSIPANRVSTLIVVAGGSPQVTVSASSSIYSRSVVLAFANDCLALPAGLEFVDDLDTAGGGYEQ